MKKYEISKYISYLVRQIPSDSTIQSNIPPDNEISRPLFSRFHQVFPIPPNSTDFTIQSDPIFFTVKKSKLSLYADDCVL